VRISALAQLIEIHMANGIVTTAALMAKTGYSERSIWNAKRELQVQPAAGAEGAAECTHTVQPDAPTVQPAAGCNKKEISPTPPKEKTTLPRTTLSNSSEVAAAASARKVADAALLSDDDLEAKLIEACNGALDNPANCSGLLNLSIPKMWLREGADLDGVVLPTLRAAGKRYHGKRVRDWSYFTGMVTEAKNRVAKGLPEQPEPAREGYGARALAAGARRRAAREAAAAMEAAHG